MISDIKPATQNKAGRIRVICRRMSSSLSQTMNKKTRQEFVLGNQRILCGAPDAMTIDTRLADQTSAGHRRLRCDMW